MQIDESDLWTASVSDAVEVDISIREQFLREGYSVIRNVFEKQLVSNLCATFVSDYEYRFDQELSANMLLVGNGRKTFEVHVSGIFNHDQIYANQKIYPLMNSLLGDYFIVGSYGAVTSFPGALKQHVHYDHPPLFAESNPEGIHQKIPPYGVHCFIPLVDINEQNGRTRIWPGSHHLPVSSKSNLINKGEYVEEDLQQGDCLLMDYRTLHAGLENNSSEIRPLLYLIYQRGWFRDIANFGQHEPLVISEAELDRIPQKYQHLFSWKLDKNWSMIEKF
jgi:ectoine hydroxylase-related dioxygenase (phytanoyl-CoA dioxygenase family)